MGNILYFIAVILVIAWLIGFLGYHAGAFIHFLLAPRYSGAETIIADRSTRFPAQKVHPI
jgi:hypothetical protein